MRYSSRLPVASVVAALLISALLPPSNGQADGQEDPWGPPVKLVDDERVMDIGPVITTRDGTAVATWTVTSADGEHVHTAQRELGADTWSTPTQVTQGHVRVWTYELVERRNRAMLFWQGSTDDDSGFSIWSRPLRADGTWGPVDKVLDMEGARIVRLEAVAGGDRTLAVMTINSAGRGVVVRKVGAGHWDAPLGLPDAFSGKKLAVDANRLTVAGVRYGSGEDPPAIEVLTWSGSWTAQRLGPQLGRELDVPNISVRSATNSSGTHAFAWKELAEDDPDGPVALVVAYRAADEAEVGGPVVLSASVPCRYGVFCGDIGMSRTGVVTAVWPDADGLVLSRRDKDDGTWSPPRVLLTSDSELYPTVDVHMTGTALVAVAADVGADERLHLVSCSGRRGCGEPTILTTPPTWVPSDMSAGPSRSGTYLWGSGCRTEECYPRHVMARSLPGVRE